MEANQKYYRYGINSIFAQLLAISGLCTLQIALGAGEMFCFVNVNSASNNRTLLDCLFCACTLLGCAQSTLLLGRLGHRKCVLLACAEYLVAGLGAHVTGGHAAGACAMALAEGASVGPCLAYIGETCEPRLRSSACAAVFALRYAGVTTFVWAFSGRGFDPAAFPVTTAAVFLLATIAIVALKMPDSPTWLLTKGKRGEARRTLGILRGNISDDACAPEFQQIVKYTLTANDCNALTAFHENSEDDNDVSSPWKQLLRPEVLRPFRRMVCHTIIMNFLFRSHILFRVKDIYKYIICKNSENEESTLDISQWLYLPLMGNVLTVLLVNVLGKRILSIYSLSITSVTYIMYSLLTVIEYEYYAKRKTRDVELEYVFNHKEFVFNFIAFLIPSVGILPIANMLIAEVFPAKSRYITCNICSALLFITNFTMQIYHVEIMKAVDSLIVTDNSTSYSILPLIFGILGLLDYFYTYYYQKETENRTLREIYIMLK